jgi:hypothetical protein|nr:MAG TPA: hypothetical protein [Caudoviricetes sp.]
MNGIIINDKQYIFLKTDKSVDCDKCDLNEDGVCRNSVICESFHYLLHGSEGCGVFKELKEEK